MRKHRKTIKYGIDTDLEMEEVIDVYGILGAKDKIETSIVNHQIMQKREKNINNIKNLTLGVGLGLIGYGVYSYVKGE